MFFKLKSFIWKGISHVASLLYILVMTTRKPYQGYRHVKGEYTFVRNITETLLKKFGLLRSFQKKISVDAQDNPIPWYTYPAIEYLEQFDFSDKIIFEYGMGNSTLYWSKYAKKVICADDNQDWYQQITNQCNHNVTAYFEPNEQQYPATVMKAGIMFDIIVIDAIKRDECALFALKQIAEDGIIIIDDTERVNWSEEYKRALHILQQDNRFIQIDFYGFSAINEYTKITTLFISRRASLESKHKEQPAYGIGNIQNK